MTKILRDIREQAEIAELMEKLTAADPTGKWISDFVKSDNPRFAGKSKKERIKMALGAAYAAKRQNEEIEIDEAAWGQDKMANLKAAHDRHAEKAIAANRAGDHDAVKVHQSKMNMIKTQMNRLRKEEAEIDEGLQQTLRKVVPGYAKRQIDRKMDAEKFGRRDVDKDANFWRYKKIQDKLKNEEVEAVAEAGPFSYGVKKPRKGSVADLAAKKRQEQERSKQPIEPRDQMVGVAKVTKEESDLMSPAETYKKLAVKHLRDSMNKNATQKQRDYAKMMNRRALEASKMDNHTDALNHYRGMQEEFEVELEEAWTQGNRNPQKGVKVGSKVRSYDFPGMHDDHYIEGHVIGEGPHSYQIKVNKVIRAGKELPVPAHMQHVEAPKGRGMFSSAYAVHKILDKQNQEAAAPEEAKGAAKTFTGMRRR